MDHPFLQEVCAIFMHARQVLRERRRYRAYGGELGLERNYQILRRRLVQPVILGSIFRSIRLHNDARWNNQLSSRQFVRVSRAKLNA